MDKRLQLRAIVHAAQKLRVSTAHVLAIIEVETGGRSGFLPDGRPRILYESHIFYMQTKGRYGERYPVSSRKWGTWGYGTFTEQWRRFDLAAALDRPAAIESCSWGLFQILGQNWPSLGYADTEEFYDCMWKDEAAHLDAFVRFIRANQLNEMLRAGDTTPDSWRDFARRYNGPGYASHNYHGRCAAALQKYQQKDPLFQALLEKGETLATLFA